MWEKNYTEELGEFFEPRGLGPSAIGGVGGDSIVGSCDGGFILESLVNVFVEGPIMPPPSPRDTLAEHILWRINGEGEVIRLTKMTDLSNETSWWEFGYMYGWLKARGMVRGGNGTFVLAGNFYLDPYFGRPEPYIVKFRDPGLVGVECPETIPEPIAEPALLLVISSLILLPLVLLLIPGLLRRAKARGI